ncbi:MAG: metallophosphoesterase family protein [Candidatus Micrarchaeota archaeon]|nr:metallophosphoesterase family protein [Candidatus Micrarchaeota archaeon]
MLVQIHSDIHFEESYYHGTYEGTAKDRLLKMLKAHGPQELIVTGDSGHKWTVADWEDITKIVQLTLLYGNHDDLKTLVRVRNADGTRALVDDGEVRSIGGLRFGFINGIIGSRPKEGIPRKTPREFMLVARELKSQGVDVLCMHDSPITDARMSPTAHTRNVIYSAVMEMQPYYSIAGHVHGGTSIGYIGRTLHANIDSSQKWETYATLDTSKMKLSIWQAMNRKPSIEYIRTDAPQRELADVARDRKLSQKVADLFGRRHDSNRAGERQKPVPLTAA